MEGDESMNIGAALLRLSAGEKIRHKDWGPEYYLYMFENRIYMFNGCQSHTNMSIETNQLNWNSQGWEIHDGKVPFSSLKPGDKFYHNNHMYIRLKNVNAIAVNSVNMNTFETAYFCCYDDRVKKA